MPFTDRCRPTFGAPMASKKTRKRSAAAGKRKSTPPGTEPAELPCRHVEVEIDPEPFERALDREGYLRAETPEAALILAAAEALRWSRAEEKPSTCVVEGPRRQAGPVFRTLPPVLNGLRPWRSVMSGGVGGARSTTKRS